MFPSPRGPNVTLQFHEDVSSSYHSLFQEGRLTDVKIVVNGTDFMAHKLILASQSPFFETMFYNPFMIESTTNEVQLKETDADIFRLVLKIVYGGCLESADRIDADMLVRLYILLERYQFIKFETSFLQEIAQKLLCPDNFWQFLDVAVYYSVKSFIELCFEYFDLLSKRDKSGSPIIKHEDQSTLFAHDYFVKISHDTLKVLLDRNLNCPEMLLLRSTQKWIDYNLNSITNNEKWLLVKRIRLNLISEYELLNCVKISEIDYNDLSEALELIQSRYDNIIDFFMLTQYGVSKHSLDYHDLLKKARQSIVKNRSFFISNYNICQEDFGFQINNGDNFNHSMESESSFATCEQIEKPVEIIISLGFPFKLNFIDLVLSDLKGDKYSYMLEYSVDGFNWSVLYDYRKYLCSNHQTLYFNPLVSRYFRLKGFHQNRMDVRTRKAFKCIKSFKAFYKELNATIDVRLTDGILNSSFYACQIKHRVYCDSTVNLSTDERFYCQKMSKEQNTQYVDGCIFQGFKPIFVLFDQPIVLSSFGINLYDRDHCAYSYLVDILDQNKLTWECVADRTNEQCAGWQNIVFSSRPVNLIRIVCTSIHNSPFQEFRIFKFNFNTNGLRI